MFLVSVSLTGCAFKQPAIDYDRDFAPAALASDPPKPVKVVTLAKALPLPHLAPIFLACGTISYKVGQLGKSNVLEPSRFLLHDPFRNDIKIRHLS